MMRIQFVLLFVIIAILALLTALASAGASLANGVANAASATALMTSQCVSAFMVFTAVFAGITIGVGISAFLSNRRPNPALPPTPGQAPRPFILPVHTSQPRLPEPAQSQPVYYPPAEAESEAVEEEALFKGWGW